MFLSCQLRLFVFLNYLSVGIYMALWCKLNGIYEDCSSSIGFAPQYTVTVNFIKGIHRLCDRLLVSYENREVNINDYYCISIRS